MRKFLRHLFIPHHTNNHRAKVLHLESLLSLVLVLVIFNFGLRAVYRGFPDILGYATDIRVESLLSETNQRRQALGMSSLALNQSLSQAAARKAQDMFSHNYWAHNSPLGKTPWDFIVASGYRYTLAGENLAKNFSDSHGVIEAWMNSPTHRDNILKSGYRDIGFAVVNGSLNGEETTLVVQMFGTSAAPIAALPQVRPAILEEASKTEEQLPLWSPPPAVESAFAAVTKKPLFNIPTVTRDTVFLFIGVLLGVLVVDAWLTARRHVVRLTGHNLAHILFLGALLLGINALQYRGSLL